MEVHVPKIKEEKLTEPEKEDEESVMETITNSSKYIIGLIVILLLILCLSPLFYYWWLSKKAKNNTSVFALSKVNYKNANFILNQMGIPRGHQTPMLYARDTIDPKFGTNFEAFISIYQKQKYSEATLTEEEKNLVQNFYGDFNQKVFAKYTKSQKFFNFIKPNKWIHFMLNLNLKK